MSKKKNTLKDLDEFLKQQAATLVSPQRLSEKTETSEPVAVPKTPAEKETLAPVQNRTPDKTISSASIANDLKHLALTNGTTVGEEFCNILLTAMERQDEFSPEDKMLINTALYVKHGSNWKEAIRQYWKNKKS
jgi:hypothetical protein